MKGQSIGVSEWSLGDIQGSLINRVPDEDTLSVDSVVPFKELKRFVMKGIVIFIMNLVLQ